MTTRQEGPNRSSFDTVPSSTMNPRPRTKCNVSPTAASRFESRSIERLDGGRLRASGAGGVNRRDLIPADDFAEPSEQEVGDGCLQWRQCDPRPPDAHDPGVDVDHRDRLVRQRHVIEARRIGGEVLGSADPSFRAASQRDDAGIEIDGVDGFTDPVLELVGVGRGRLAGRDHEDARRPSRGQGPTVWLLGGPGEYGVRRVVSRHVARRGPRGNALPRKFLFGARCRAQLGDGGRIDASNAWIAPRSGGIVLLEPSRWTGSIG